MLNFKKLMSLFLAVLMLCGALTGLSVISVSAAEAGTTAAAEEESFADDSEGRTERFHTVKFATPEEKLATMQKMRDNESDRYILYADQRSGEVAIQDRLTGQVLFTNPYDIGHSNATANVKNRLMSQIIVTFKNVESDNKQIYSSFEHAAAKDQVKVKNIKNGIRVEYTIGREEARRLVPRSITKERFEDLILAPMEEYYGITREEAEAIRNDSKHPLYAQGFYLRKQLAYFAYKDLDEASSDRLKQDMLAAFPILSKFDIYVLESTASTTEIEKIEQVIKSACPNYTYEEMDYDHQLTEYTSEEENPPLFKMALEYTIDDVEGINVRLPANGIRFNESKFELLNLQILPYLGAGNNAYEGYAFFPDGAGALFAFEDMLEQTNETITAKIYGEDYAYHKLEQKYQQIVRYPVYGIVENTRYYDFSIYNEVLDDDETVTISGVVYDHLQKVLEDGTAANDPIYKKYRNLLDNGDMTERVQKNGYVAVIEEGDALTSLSYVHEGTQAPYDTISMIANPRPRDEYNLADAISVGDNKTVSVVTDRKYVGNYKLHISLLSDKTVAEQAMKDNTLKADEWYEASWLGMGIAYRDYLVRHKYLTALDASVAEKDIPLYIESFGAMETIEKFLSVPVEVMRPLTSAADVNTMFEELSSQGVTNINFKLTGYANGGMYATIPYNLKWEKAVSKDVSMQELFNLAALSHNSSADVKVSEILDTSDRKVEDFIKTYTTLDMDAFTAKYGKTGDQVSAMTLAEFQELCQIPDGQFNVYPDFDFAYVSATDLFDGFSLRKHVVRTIDDRYSYKREYMATQQRYAGYFQLAVSPAYFSRFYKKLMSKYITYDNVAGISVSTLGTALNSDFDEDEPYNREDAKTFAKTALEFISGQKGGDLEVMVNGGNAYTWQYVDHIIGAAVDSSRYIVASYSVPFLGVVLHGYKNFTGTPLNMEGDLDYAKLKAIENGASIYFTLSYQNTQNLKEDYQLSKYYSVRYDIWFDDVVEIYNELNSELKDVQTMPIIGHSFLAGMRVPDTDELDRDLKEEFDFVMNFQGNQQAFLDQLKTEAVADARTLIATLGETIKSKIKSSTGFYAGGTGTAGAAATYQKAFLDALSNYRKALDDYDRIAALNLQGEADDEELTAATATVEKQKKKLNTAVRDMAKNIIKIRNAMAEIEELLEVARTGVELIETTAGCPQNIVDEVRELYAQAVAYSEEQMGMGFADTTANLEIQTFLNIQYVVVIEALKGDPNYVGENIIGQLEKQYLAIGQEKFGLLKDKGTYVFLRYLEANKELTDAELDEKYNLSADVPSMDGLIQFVKEMIGSDVSFDPVLDALGGVDAGIKQYIKNVFLEKLALTDNKNLGEYQNQDDANQALKYLHINPNQKGSTFNVNNKNIFEVLKLINAKITAGPVADMKKATDGNYQLSAVYSEDKMNKLIADIEAILAEHEYDAVQVVKEAVDAEVKALDEQIAAVEADTSLDDKAKDKEKKALESKKTAAKAKLSKLFPIEYLTTDPDERKTEIVSYINAFYYTRVLSEKKPEKGYALPVLNAKSNSMDSLNRLFTSRSESYVIDKENNKYLYSEFINAYENDLANVKAMLSSINAQLAPYGDVSTELEQAYYTLFVNYVMKNQKAPGKLEAEKAEDDKQGANSNKTKLNADAEALVAERLPSIQTYADVDALAADILALHEGYTFKEGYDPAEMSTAYAYHAYFDYLADNQVEDVTAHKFYYDETIAKMDVAVMTRVEEKKAQILSMIPADASFMEYIDAVFTVIADPDDLTYKFTNEVASQVIYAPAKKGTIEEDVTEYYLYQLLNSVRSAALGKIGDYDISVYSKDPNKLDNQKKNVKTAITDYVTPLLADMMEKAKTGVAPGGTPNYALEAVYGAEDYDKLIMDIYAYVTSDALGYSFDPAVDMEQIKEEIGDIVKFQFYETVYKRLNCAKPVDFNLHEIYNSSLEESCTNLKKLVEYYVVSYEYLTQEEFDNYFVTKSTDDDDATEEEASRYVSDDGRIVSVTYGQPKAEGGYTPYKTFVLNYNNFSVNVVYEGITYTIPAYGYVTVHHTDK